MNGKNGVFLCLGYWSTVEKQWHFFWNQEPPEKRRSTEQFFSELSNIKTIAKCLATHRFGWHGLTFNLKQNLYIFAPYWTNWRLCQCLAGIEFSPPHNSFIRLPVSLLIFVIHVIRSFSSSLLQTICRHLPSFLHLIAVCRMRELRLNKLVHVDIRYMYK